MTSFKLAVAAALSSLAVSAFALAPMQDADLSDVSGQDGVTIGANLNINIGSFVYTDTDSNGGSISFKNIEIRGAIAAEIDIINNATALGTLAAVGVAAAGAPAGFMPAGDVVRIALPEATVGNAAAGLSHAVTTRGAARTSNNLYVGVDSMTMGNSTKSFGAVAMNDIKMQGTTVLIWAH